MDAYALLCYNDRTDGNSRCCSGVRRSRGRRPGDKKTEWSSRLARSLGIRLPMLSAQEDFEHLIEDLCENELGPESLVQMRGRRGQRQQGVDVYGQPPGLAGAYLGYQCKAYAVDNPLTKAKVWDEVNKAKTFPLSPFVKLVIAITHPRNTTEQDVISTVSDENQRQGSFPVEGMFWDDIERKLALYPRLLIDHYPGLLTTITNTAVARALVNTPLHLAYVALPPRTEPSQLEIELRLRGIRLVNLDDAGGLNGLGRPAPDGYLYYWVGEETGVARPEIKRFARSLAASLQQGAPVFIVAPPDVWDLVYEQLDLPQEAHIRYFPSSTNVVSIAQTMFRRVFSRGYERRGALTTVRMSAHSAGLQCEGLLDLDWQPLIDNQAVPKQFPTPEVWETRLVPALLDVKQQIASLPKQTALVVDAILPLPAAVAVGYHLNLGIATLVAQGREAGASRRACQFWYSDAAAGPAQPRYFEKQLTDRKPMSAILELTTFTRIGADIDRFTHAYPVPADLWGVIERNENATTNIAEAEAVAYAEFVARTARVLNGRGVSDLHLFVRAPAALGLLIGHRLRNCGRLHLYWYDNPTYRYACTLA